MNEHTKTALMAAGIIMSGLVVGYLMGEHDKHFAEHRPSVVDTQPAQPAPDPELNSQIDDSKPVVLRGTAAQLAPTTCSLAQTPGGWKETCGPAHVDPGPDDCDPGMVRVCIRAWGNNRSCDCYPE